MPLLLLVHATNTALQPTVTSCIPCTLFAWNETVALLLETTAG
jgi:hypothetical protein